MSKLVEVARGMIGTPFKHQGRLPGVGVDCAGLVICALADVGIRIRDVKGYGRLPAHGVFMGLVEESCNRIDQADIQIGDLMVFAFRSEPQHIAIVSCVDPVRIIHAYSEIGRVVEHGLNDVWRSRLRGCYRVKGRD
jgi:cell wall-associated NlpC family hydrolase